MSKTPMVLHETWRLMPGAPTCDVYTPADDGIREAMEPEGYFVIAPGLGSVKADYSRLARDIAARGFTVLSPNCNTALPDSNVSDALDRRAETIVRTIDAWGGRKVRFLPHSLGGPVTIKALEQMGKFDKAQDESGEVLSVSFMQPAGFDRHGWLDIVKAARFFMGEAMPRTARLLPDLVRNPYAVYERLDMGQRASEIKGLWNLPEGFMARGVRNIQGSGIFANFLVGPKDSLTRSGPIREVAAPIVGDENVIDIHPEAGHLSAQTHSRRVASLLLANLASLQDPSMSLAEVSDVNTKKPLVAA